MRLLSLRSANTRSIGGLLLLLRCQRMLPFFGIGSTDRLVAVGENVVRHFRSSVYRKECHESEIGCSEGELSETARTGWLSFARLEIIEMLRREALAFLSFDTLEIIDN